jgi:hypothetical protein
LLITEVSNLIGADVPTLVLDQQRALWRVPPWIGFPRQGRMGTVGTVDVDAATGEIVDRSASQVKIEQQARQLAALLPPYQPRRNIPPEVLATHVSPAPVAPLRAAA